MANPEQPGLAFARAWKLIPKSNSSACQRINARIRLPSKQQWNKLILLFFAFQTRLPAKPLRSRPRWATGVRAFSTRRLRIGLRKAGRTAFQSLPPARPKRLQAQGVLPTQAA